MEIEINGIKYQKTIESPKRMPKCNDLYTLLG